MEIRNARHRRMHLVCFSFHEILEWARYSQESEDVSDSPRRKLEGKLQERTFRVTEMSDLDHVCGDVWVDTCRNSTTVHLKCILNKFKLNKGK